MRRNHSYGVRHDPTLASVLLCCLRQLMDLLGHGCHDHRYGDRVQQVETAVVLAEPSAAVDTVEVVRLAVSTDDAAEGFGAEVADSVAHNHEYPLILRLIAEERFTIELVLLDQFVCDLLCLVGHDLPFKPQAWKLSSWAVNTLYRVLTAQL